MIFALVHILNALIRAPTAGFEKDATKIESRLDKIDRKAKSVKGGGGLLDAKGANGGGLMSMGMLKGGAALAGVAVVGSVLKQMTEEISKSTASLRLNEITFGQWADQVTSATPVIGTFWDTFKGGSRILHDINADLIRFAGYSEDVARSWESAQTAMDRTAKFGLQLESVTGAWLSSLDDLALEQSSGLERRMLEINQQFNATLDGIREQRAALEKWAQQDGDSQMLRSMREMLDEAERTQRQVRDIRQQKARDDEKRPEMDALKAAAEATKLGLREPIDVAIDEMIALQKQFEAGFLERNEWQAAWQKLRAEFDEATSIRTFQSPTAVRRGSQAEASIDIEAQQRRMARDQDNPQLKRLDEQIRQFSLFNDFLQQIAENTANDDVRTLGLTVGN